MITVDHDHDFSILPVQNDHHEHCDDDYHEHHADDPHKHQDDDHKHEYDDCHLKSETLTFLSVDRNNKGNVSSRPVGELQSS